MHFLTHKIANVRAAQEQHRNAFIDRSPYEDAEIFAEHFHDDGGMDARAIKTYREASAQFFASLPQPDLFIYCSAPLAILEERVKTRGREYEQRYPPGHLIDLQRRYDQWIQEIAKRFPRKILMVDTEKQDFRPGSPAIFDAAQDVINKLMMLWFEEEGRVFEQMSLFQAPLTISSIETQSDPMGLRPYVRPEMGFTIPQTTILKPYSPIEGSLKVDRKASRKRLRAYIAAPFTGRAGPPPVIVSQSEDLPGIDLTPVLPHGLLDPVHAQWLLGIEGLVKQQGFQTTVPHRDVNKWGQRILQPEAAIAECTKEILRCDVLIAFPETSFGVHYEIGIATGANIPIIVLSQEENTLSFLMRGIESINDAQLLYYRSAEELKIKLTNALSKIKKG